MLSKEEYVSFFKEVSVNVNNKYITIEECAMAYDLDLESLIAEFAESGDINSSIYYAITRKTYIEFLTDYLFALPISKIEESFSIYKKARSLVDETKTDVLQYIYNSAGDILELSKIEILVLLVSNNLHNELMKPLIDTKDRDKIDSLINYCIDPDTPEPIKMKRQEVKRLVYIMDEYRISSKEFGLLINHYIKHVQNSDIEDPYYEDPCYLEIEDLEMEDDDI